MQEKDYFMGDAIRFTGRIVHLHGGTFREFIYLEGHKAGQKGLKGISVDLSLKASSVASGYLSR